MLKLAGKVRRIQLTEVQDRPLLLQISTNPVLPKVMRATRAFLMSDGELPEGYQHYLIPASLEWRAGELEGKGSFTLLPDDYDYLGNEDIIRLDGQAIRVLFRANSGHNSLLVTEQCNHYCLMCSQPPKNVDDSWILNELEALIPLIPRDTPEVGFSGGEPTLAKDRFINLIRMMKSYLPRTVVHVLSNGRAFADEHFSQQYAELDHPDLMVGIPLYSDDPSLHDYIVQAPGAFQETVQGILNLKRLGQKVEIRIVLHKQSISRLPQLCEYIARNLLFVDHVTLMGLEMIGFTRANLDELWIDPVDYRDILSEAVAILAAYRMNVSVYNHPLCIVNNDVLPYYRKSISDWKNEYVPECEGCVRKSECGGFFSSGVRNGYSRAIMPFLK